MSVATFVTEELGLAGEGVDLVHACCECDPDKGLCGRDVTDATVVDSDDLVDCVVCAVMVGSPCAACGNPLLS